MAGLATATCAAPVVKLGRCRLTAAGRPYPTRVVDLVLETPVVDMLSLLTADWAKLDRWRSAPDALSSRDVDRIVESGVAAFHPAVRLPSIDPFGATLGWLQGWRRFVGFHRDRFGLIETVDDLQRLGAPNPVGILMGMQDSAHFRTAADVEAFAALGQRVSQLTYNRSNALGGGCYDPADPALSAFGGEIVGAMNSVGMLIDVSHCGRRTTLDAIEASRRAIAITHSNCAALNPYEPRCKSDEAIKRLASKGGVFGVTAIRKFVARRGASLEGMLDHFEHVARLVGVEHVGLGSDSDLEGGQPVIRALGHPLYVFDIAEGLLRRGFTERAVSLVLGRNFLRILFEALPDSQRLLTASAPTLG